MEQKQSVKKQKLWAFLEGFFRSACLLMFISALCGGFRYMVEQGFIYRGAGVIATFVCLFVAGAVTEIFKTMFLKKRIKIAPIVLDLLIFLVSVVVLALSFGRDGQSYPAMDGVFAKLVSSEVMAGPMWYKPGLIWYVVCACSAISLVLRYKEKKLLAEVLIGVFTAIVLYFAILIPIEDYLFNAFINSGDQVVLSDDSTVASHIIAVASCIGIMITHATSSIMSIREEE